MQFVIDPPIATKMSKMAQRVRWHDASLAQRQIDQSRLVLDVENSDSPEFSFLVIGDTGSGPEHGQNPQRRIAEQLLPHLEHSSFVLHTGDVIYLVGSREYYPSNFIHPYKEFLVGGEQPQKICYDQMVFKTPMFVVPGNHDYYDLPFLRGLLSGATLSLRRFKWFKLDFNIGWYGSNQGEAYASAFLDCLCRFKTQGDLERHLAQHYTAKTETGYCLRYCPGQFTRLPNRYYTFRYGGIDFFALDSNTFNAPQPIPDTRQGEAYRHALEQQRQQLQQQNEQMLKTSDKLNRDRPQDAEHLSDLRTKLQQSEQVRLDIDKQLNTHTPPTVDWEQLAWLQQRLIDSWHNDDVRGRVIFFHHPPYVTEATKWYQAQTLTVRNHLRYVLDNVAAAVGAKAQNRSLVDLVLNGHAHCLEHIRTLETGHGDANINWLVCGGSGYSLRRQREEGAELTESFNVDDDKQERLVARSHLYIGRNGHGSQKRRPYSFLKIDVRSGSPPQFVVHPFVTERFQYQWSSYELSPFKL